MTNDVMSDLYNAYVSQRVANGESKEAAEARLADNASFLLSMTKDSAKSEQILRQALRRYLSPENSEVLSEIVEDMLWDNR